MKIRIGSKPSWAPMGAASVAAVTTATVPEPYTILSTAAITEGMRINGKPTICTMLAPAPEDFKICPSAPPAAVIKTIGPASFKEVDMIGFFATGI